MNDMKQALGLAELEAKIDQLISLVVPKTDGPEWWDINQAAEYLECSTRTVERRVKSGELQAHRPYGNRRYFSRAAVQSLRHQGYNTSKAG